MRKGYMTAFLTLSLTLILALVFTVIEGARISAIRMKFECVTDIGMNSVLAEYHRELLEQYDLLFVDTSYGGGQPAIANTEAHLQHYIQQNLTTENTGGFFPVVDFLAMNTEQVTISQYSIASDDGGGVLKRQVTDYMADYPVGAALSVLDGWSGQIGQLAQRNIAAERESYQAQIEAIGLPEQEVEEGVMEKVPLNNPADIANATRSSGVLNLVLDDTTQLSKVRIATEEYISHRECRRGTGICKEAVDLTGDVNELIFQTYLFEKCGYYGEELDKSLLKYQIEYILKGKDTDWQNLEAVAKQLLAWREVANVIYILSDGAKMAEAEALAMTLAAVTLMPELLVPVKYTILFAWAYVESLQDVRILLRGGRVPIYKTAADWKTDIHSILNVKGSLTDEAGEGTGLSYKEYLQVMLFLENAGNRTYRAMDIMEMDIRQTPGNGTFCLDGCFDTYQARIAVNSRFGYRYEMTRQYGFY